MLVSMKGNVEIHGEAPEVLAEMVVLIKSFRNYLASVVGEEIADEHIALVAKLAYTDSSELDDFDAEEFIRSYRSAK